MPESWTAITTSGRPVSTRQATSTLMPVTPRSSFVLELTTGSVLQKFVLAYFHLLPLQVPGSPLISFASGTQFAGMADVSQRVQFPVPIPVQHAGGVLPHTQQLSGVAQ